MLLFHSGEVGSIPTRVTRWVEMEIGSCGLVGLSAADNRGVLSSILRTTTYEFVERGDFPCNAQLTSNARPCSNRVVV